MTRKSLFLLFIFSAFAIANVYAENKLEIYELKKGNFSVKLTNWGATVVSLTLPDNKGKLGDIVLGFDTPEEYKNDSAYFGSIVGRVANRINGAQFTYNGIQYNLTANDGNNMLHGGKPGFSDVLWKTLKYQTKSHSPKVIFSYTSPDGDQGFPGKLVVSVTYKLIGENKLSVTMKAKTADKATPVNLAQHTYWNLAGHNSGDILSQKVQIFGSKITLVDDKLIPTGKLLPVKGTPYDFLEPHRIGSRINELPNGYDINYVLDGSIGKQMKKAAIVHDKKSGRIMELWTNEPGMQFYTSNTLELKGKGGFVYKPHAALCLETQGFPDAVNHPNFPSQIVDVGKTYKHQMLYKFTTK